MKHREWTKLACALLALVMVLTTMAACNPPIESDQESTTGDKAPETAAVEETTAEPVADTTQVTTDTTGSTSDTTGGEADTTAADDETVPESQTDEPETLSPEQEKMMEIEAYLDTVKYHDFELTGENTPFYMGRWFAKDLEGVSHMVTVTDGSLLYFLVEGATEFHVEFTNITPAMATPYFAYSIDGATPVRQMITNGRVPLPSEGMHTVRIIADGMTEGDGTIKWEKEQGFALKEVSAPGGEIYGIKPTDKVIFFYGDSITEGINALGNSANSLSNSATNAYSWFASKSLGAVGYIIGHGASGITRPGSFSTMLDAIDYLSATRDLVDHPNANIEPDLIVVNHGANDGMAGTSNADFESALRETLARLTERYPGVPVIYIMPFMESWQENVRAYGPIVDKVAAEFDGIHVVHTDTWGASEGIGRGFDVTTDSLHPNANGAMMIGRKVATEIRAIMGADFFK